MLALRLIMQASKDVIKTIKCHHIGMLIWQAVKVYWYTSVIAMFSSTLNGINTLHYARVNTATE